MKVKVKSFLFPCQLDLYYLQYLIPAINRVLCTYVRLHFVPVSVLIKKCLQSIRDFVTIEFEIKWEETMICSTSRAPRNLCICTTKTHTENLLFTLTKRISLCTNQSNKDACQLSMYLRGEHSSYIKPDRIFVIFSPQSFSPHRFFSTEILNKNGINFDKTP